MYSYDKVLTFVREEDVKFIRLVFFELLAFRKIYQLCPKNWSGHSEMVFPLMLRQSRALAMK